MESQVAKKANAGALATINLRADSGKGAEEIKSDDVSTPILKILHQLSPECNERDAKHVEGAKPGMIYASGFSSSRNSFRDSSRCCGRKKWKIQITKW